LFLHYISNAKTDYQKKSTSCDIALIDLLFTTGIRISEVCCLKYEQFDFYGRSIRIGEKGRKERIITFDNSEVIQCLRTSFSFSSNSIADEAAAF